MSIVRPFAKCLLLGLLGLGFCAHAAWAETVNVSELWPSQQRLGVKSARRNIEEAKRSAKAKGMSLREFTEQVLKPKALRKIAPTSKWIDGRLIQEDKHNGVWSGARLQKKTGVALDVSTDTMADYRGMTEEEAAHDFINVRGKGRLDKKHDGKSAVEKMRILLRQKTPKLKDDRLRSTIDTAFDRLQLDGEMFTDYIEIDLGRLMREQKIFRDLREAGLLKKGEKEIPNKKVFRRKIVKFVADRLKTDFRDYLLAHARSPEQVPKILSKLGD
jgi:hypothetical protein